MGLVTKYFTSNGTWVCPAGVTRVMLVGAGGGGGGGRGYDNTYAVGGGGGGGSVEMTSIVNVVPNTSYSITIGSGGTGSIYTNNKGDDGGDTTFGSLCTFAGAEGGHSYASVEPFTCVGGSNCKYSSGIVQSWAYDGATNRSHKKVIVPVPGKGGNRLGAFGGYVPNSMSIEFTACANAKGFAGGASGSGANGGGGGGGGGPKGIGTNGTDYTAGSSPSATNVGANTGAGGGGSGAGTAGSGNGGNGGSGYLYVIFEDG